jgi:hypothetical protein
MVPPAENPTLFGRLPSLPNTAYGAEVTIAPTKQLYISYGIFDGNNARGVQTGIQARTRAALSPTRNMAIPIPSPPR